MKLNIFQIPPHRVAPMLAKLADAGMASVHREKIGQWNAEFFFSINPGSIEIPWVAEFANELQALESVPTNLAHYGAYIWRRQGVCYALSFGKSHFYLREFCDTDFGLSMAKRIGDKEDVRQKAARRYAGQSRKEISSYLRDSSLDIGSGESVDYLHATTRDADTWGVSAKFGASILVSPSITHEELPAFFDRITAELKRPELFALPRTEVIKDKAIIVKYDQWLVRAILSEEVYFEQSAYQLVGGDFVFPTSEKYYFQRRRAKSAKLDSPSVPALRGFIQQHDIRDHEILNIKVKVLREEGKEYSQTLKKSLECSIEEDKVFLMRGEWVRFNDDYVSFLDSYVDTIQIDTSVEEDFKIISLGEPAFNKALLEHDYEVADKDFSIIKLRNYTIEAWDLKRGTTAYAVKFGNAQKLGYVCDQASNILKIYRNEPATFKNIELTAYCLWLGFDRANTPTRLSEVNSIIFKQKLEEWARKCRTMNIQPLVRISRKIPKAGGDVGVMTRGSPE